MNDTVDRTPASIWPGDSNQRHMVVSLPEAVVPYENDLRRFFDAMVYKLNRNARKGRWEKYSVSDAMRLLEGEVEELKTALGSRNVVEITLEAADIANFALILANIAIDRG